MKGTNRPYIHARGGEKETDSHAKRCDARGHGVCTTRQEPWPVMKKAYESAGSQPRFENIGTPIGTGGATLKIEITSSFKECRMRSQSGGIGSPSTTVPLGCGLRVSHRLAIIAVKPSEQLTT